MKPAHLHLSALIPLLLATPSMAEDVCDTEAIVQLSQQQQSHGKTYRAIETLTQAQQQCPHPRLNLELGALYYRLGQTERAITLWETTLQENTLPASVSQNVKLRIIQARLNPPERFTSHTYLHLNSRYKQSSGTTTGAGISVLPRYRLSAINLAGYSFKPALYGKLQGETLYSWSDKKTSNAFTLEGGFDIRSQSVDWQAGLLTESVNQQSTSSIVSDLSLKASILQWQSEWEWSTDYPLFRADETLSATFSSVQLSSAGQWQMDDSQWRFNEASLEIKGTTGSKPTLTLTRNLEEEQWQLDSKIRWPLADNVWLNTYAGTTWSNYTDWYVKFSLYWRLF